MISAFVFSPLVLIALVWPYFMLQWARPGDAVTYPLTSESLSALPKRQCEPKPFAAFTHKPHATPAWDGADEGAPCRACMLSILIVLCRILITRTFLRKPHLPVTLCPQWWNTQQPAER